MFASRCDCAGHRRADCGSVRLTAALLVVLCCPLAISAAWALSYGYTSFPTPTAGRPSAQAPPITKAKDAPAQVISSEVNVVKVDVVVTDEDGRVLSALKKENFRILDNGRPQVVTNFVPVSAPITTAVLMEYSGVAYNYFAYKAAKWSPLLLDYLEPQDWIALVTYDLKPSIRVDFTRDKTKIRDGLSSLSFPQFREANLFDSLLDTLDRLEAIKGKKSLLLISTGANSFSSNSLDAVIDRLRRTNVTIFCIGLAESEYLANYGTNVAYLQAKNQLDTFADQTGGITYFPRFEGELPDIFRSIAAFLRSQYSLAFSPSNPAADGKYHKLKVEIVASDGKPLNIRNQKGQTREIVVYARQGYISPSPRTACGGTRKPMPDTPWRTIPRFARTEQTELPSGTTTM